MRYVLWTDSLIDSFISIDGILFLIISTIVSVIPVPVCCRLGKGADVFLASAELAAITAIEGKLPTVAQYMGYAQKIQASAADTFRYMNFDRLPDYVAKGNTAQLGDQYQGALDKELARLKKQASK